MTAELYETEFFMHSHCPLSILQSSFVYFKCIILQNVNYLLEVFCSVSCFLLHGGYLAPVLAHGLPTQCVLLARVTAFPSLPVCGNKGECNSCPNSSYHSELMLSVKCTWFAILPSHGVPNMKFCIVRQKFRHKMGISCAPVFCFVST